MPIQGKPLLVYDGDCGFCRRWILYWQHLTGDRVEYAPFQELADDRFPKIPREAFAASVQLIEPDGRITSGAHAVFRTLSYAPGKGWFLWIYERIPGFAPLAEWAYRQVAEGRPFFSKITLWLWGEHIGLPSYLLTRWIFLRLLGLVYFSAFFSLFSQVQGLMGPAGISPVGEYLKLAYRHLGPTAYRLLPTLCWINAGEAMLNLLCGVGILLSLLLFIGIAPVAALSCLWILYLSLTVAGQAFLSFQWDILLLEVGFLSIFFAPLQLRPRPLTKEAPPSWLVLLLLRWLLFRLTFSSGVIKLSSGDPTWRNLTALSFHYETQPLPTFIGWYAHQLPLWFHTASTFAMFLIELAVPFLIFAPRRLRALGGMMLISLQILIALTGNYAFFNLLAVGLCLLLFDDAIWSRRVWIGKEPLQELPRRGWPRWVTIPVAVLLITLSIVPMAGLFTPFLSEPILIFTEWFSPLHLVNGYGLFAVMTISRPEIVIEGSLDGISWEPYEFKYKPGDLKRRPSFIAPHQPRLDWQMWFAALGTVPQNLWFLRLLDRLLQGSPEVLALFKKNPFPKAPPVYVRAILYDYRFTNLSTRRSTGQWWKRRQLGPYFPSTSLKPQES